MKTLKNVLEYLENTAKVYGDKIAAIDTNNSISYNELIVNAKRLGSFLCSKSIPNRPIAVFMDKSIDTLEIFIAIVYSGCFYTLIDPSFPEKRIQQILDILDTDIIITDSKNEDYIHKILDINNKENEMINKVNIINIDIEKQILVNDMDDCKLDNIRQSMKSTDALYCNFTSGSTGTPKGVLISHEAVINFIDHFTDTFGIGNKDVIGNQAPFDFDVSVKDIYSCLKTGATLVIIPKSYFMFPTKVMDMLEEHKVTTIIWAVSALVMITRLHGLKYKVPSNLNKIMFSGEVMPLKQLNKWRKIYKDAMFVNLYGPTEITCNCTYYILNREYKDEDKIPIGKPFASHNVFLLDEGKIITQDMTGKIGEICVAGKSVALGYYNNEEMTNRVFCTNPLEKSQNMYKTGDLAYWGKDGLLYFAGRSDFQIKHMGHRIELEEIEHVLRNVKCVEQACCFFDNIKNKVVAFFVGTDDKRRIIEDMKKSVPDYMIPNVFKRIETMPINKNGKTDRAMLKNMYMEGKNHG